MKTTVTAIALAATAAFAAADVQITEIWTGLSGADGTEDWIEVTWNGQGTFDTGSIFYDDSSADLGAAGQLDSFILSSGESAIFLLDADPANGAAFATAIEEFLAIWGNVSNVGYTNGGGGLGQGGDTANLLDAAGNVLDSLSYDASGDIATFEKVNGVTRLSVLGENGAYSSDQFENTNGVFGAETFGSLIGSPGVVPAPAGAALFGLGGLAAARRRRA